MNIDNDNGKVALVLSQDFGDECFALQERMPIWIIESPQNQSAVDKIRAQSGGTRQITTFHLRGNESLSATCERIVQSLDDHHNESSQTPAYCELIVFGLSLAGVSLKPFLELGFEEFVETSTGFIAKKMPKR